MSDMVNHPDHYKGAKGIEVIDVIDAFDLGFSLGNAVKYILRAGKKDNAVQDLKKAMWYIKHELDSKWEPGARKVYSEPDRVPPADPGTSELAESINDTIVKIDKAIDAIRELKPNKKGQCHAELPKERV